MSLRLINKPKAYKPVSSRQCGGISQNKKKEAIPD
jgi:hypothetical protein